MTDSKRRCDGGSDNALSILDHSVLVECALLGQSSFGNGLTW